MSLLELLNATDSYLVALAVLCVIATRISSGDDRTSTPFRLFLAMLALTALEIVLDMASLMLNERAECRTALVAIYIVYFSLQPLTTYLWALYAYHQIHYDSKPLARFALPAALPLAINLAVTMASPWTGWAFRVDEAGLYSRGELFVHTSAIPFVYLFLIAGLTLLHWKGLPRRTRVTLLSFGIPPALGGVGQAMLYGTHLLWPGVTIALLLVYLSIESELLITDHLTGLRNRRSFDQHMRRSLGPGAHAEVFALVMLDLDGFKAMNDEFVVIAGLREPGDAATLVERIRRAFEAYNEDSGRPWRLQASIGTVTSEELPAGALNRAKLIVREADRRMYEDKGTRSR